jgi:tellurite resistance protein TehA-like permease
VALTIVFVALLYSMGILATLPALRRAGSRRDYWVFFAFLAVSFALAAAVAVAPDKVPNPNDFINHMVSGFGKRFFSP